LAAGLAAEPDATSAVAPGLTRPLAARAARRLSSLVSSFFCSASCA
jgi:hypothetical protein